MSERPRAPGWVHLCAWGGLALSAAGLAAVWAGWAERDPWAGWTAAEELDRPIYAERVHVGSVFRTRANTWSNLAFFLPGLYALALGLADRRAPRLDPAPDPRSARAGYLRATPALSGLFGLACLYLGLGSALFHASLTRLGQQLDVGAMYTPLLALLAVSAGRSRPRLGRHSTWPLLAAVWVAASALLFLFKWQLPARLLMPALILAYCAARGLEHARGVHPAGRWLALSGGCLLLAVVCRELDVAGRFSGPDAWLQGHAVWHLLCAGALGAGYLDQRT